jgi:hypothetical protein
LGAAFFLAAFFLARLGGAFLAFAGERLGEAFFGRLVAATRFFYANPRSAGKPSVRSR